MQASDDIPFRFTKSDTVDGILDLDLGGRSIITWTMNAPSVFRKFELGAPSFERSPVQP